MVDQFSVCCTHTLAHVAGSGGTTGLFPKYWKAKENAAKIAAKSFKCLIQDPDLSTIGGIEIIRTHTHIHTDSRDSFVRRVEGVLMGIELPCLFEKFPEHFTVVNKPINGMVGSELLPTFCIAFAFKSWGNS